MELVSSFGVVGSGDEDSPIVVLISSTDHPRFIFVNHFTVGSCSSSMGICSAATSTKRMTLPHFGAASGLLAPSGTYRGQSGKGILTIALSVIPAVPSIRGFHRQVPNLE